MSDIWSGVVRPEALATLTSRIQLQVHMSDSLHQFLIEYGRPRQTHLKQFPIVSLICIPSLIDGC